MRCNTYSIDPTAATIALLKAAAAASADAVVTPLSALAKDLDTANEAPSAKADPKPAANPEALPDPATFAVVLEAKTTLAITSPASCGKTEVRL